MNQTIRWLVVAALAAGSSAAFAQAKEIKIAHVYDKTGVLEAYAKQTQAGLMMGIEYATGGKMEVLGRKIVIIEKDSQFKDRKSTRLNSSHIQKSRMPSSA